MHSPRYLHIALAGAALVLPAWLSADETQNCHLGYHHYRIVDIGTFGGPNSQFSTPSSKVINNRGVSIGLADTALPDPNCFFDCMIDNGFVRKDGKTTLLPALSGGLSSFPTGISEIGFVVGQSQNGITDPLTGALELRGVLWVDTYPIDLGTLGGNASVAFAVNSRGEVAGAATNRIADPYANTVMGTCYRVPTSVCPGSTFSFAALFSPTETETRAVIWRGGKANDLGTLGGPDSVALTINARGDATGWSYTSFNADPNSGVPIVDPFFWSADDRVMIDMGNLGGTFAAPYYMNNRGEVTGAANLAGDLAVHIFIWSKVKGMQDIGALGGTFGHPDWINDAGDVVGTATTATKLHRAFLWRADKMINLGTVGDDKDSEGTSVNSQGQVVGFSGVFGVADQHGWVWEHSGPIKDLNSLVVTGTPISVISATDINDRGEIAGIGALPNGDTHAIVLIPCDERHPNLAGCDYRHAE